MSTASVSPPSSVGSNKAAPKAIRPNTSSRSSPGTAPLLARPKRAQVSRACDWCRVHRVKCDTEQPCHNCRSRGAQCSTTGANEIRNLPHAFREIERLRKRVQDLEQEIARREQAPPPSSAASSQDYSQASSENSSTRLVPLVDVPSLSEDEFWREDQRGSAARGIGFYTGQGHVRQWFGPSSLFFFINRMNCQLSKFLHHTHTQTPVDAIHWGAPNQLFAITRPEARSDEPPIDFDAEVGSESCLSPLQEEYFLGFFWQSYHSFLQIIDEGSFRELYRSLWTDNSKARKPSALVDIILALCIQYDTTTPLRHGKSSCPVKDTYTAGRFHYQRCQSLLLAELECPTLSTLQCHIFSVYYLCSASYQNMAHGMIALAVRTAHILGLHLEPPTELPRPERELRKRIWWSLWIMEAKTCIKLGRPWSAPMADITCTLPSDDHQLALQSGTPVLSVGNVTWLTYTRETTKLILTMRNIYISFWHSFYRLLTTSQINDIYTSPVLLESLASTLRTLLAPLHSWTRAVPAALTCKRSPSNGPPFSVHTTTPNPLDIETFSPLWLQRQRVFLELVYHNYCIILYRPLIPFHSSSPDPSAPEVQACAEACANHAITLTRITHQAISQTDILKGHHEGFQWQWNAAITLVGFYVAYPMTESGIRAREAVDVAVEVFEIFGRHFAVGMKAARVVRELVGKTDFLLGGGVVSAGEMGIGAESDVDSPWSGHGSGGGGHMAVESSGVEWDDGRGVFGGQF
ncbi:hypothetical protein OQA88_1094 [Cercophora sp. LCS_1]